jgi:Na+-transporting NADH:ubiquinone oxidoreductase subunit A
MSDYVIKSGLDIPIAGEASGAPVDLPLPATVSYAPQELRGLVPRPQAREGEAVRVGSPLFHHKSDPRLVLRSPVSGRVKEIRRGERRVIVDYVVDVDGEDAETLPSFPMQRLSRIDRAEALEALLGSGFWPCVRTRPLSRLADPGRAPQAVLIAATETGPLQPKAEALLGADDGEALQAAIHVLRAATGAPVHVSRSAGSSLPALEGLVGVEVHTVRGPHPAGDPAVQVNLICPPRGPGGVVWTLRAWDAVALGRTLLEGRFAHRRVVAAVGTGVKAPRLVRTVHGAPLRHVVGETQENCRWIRGSILTGEQVDPDRWISFHSRAVHVLPEGVDRHLLGWAMPQLGRFSIHRAYLSGFLGSSRTLDLRPGVFGGERAIVPTSMYQRVIATPDIHPEFLFKSLVAGDLEESVQLGMLDLSEEEAALLTYICPSKVEYDQILRKGLDQYEREN